MAKSTNTLSVSNPAAATAASAGITVAEIAALTKGEVLGNGDLLIRDIKPLDSAGADEISFFAPTSQQSAAALLDKLKSCNAAAVLVAAAVPELPNTQVIVKHPLACAAELAKILKPKPVPAEGVHASAIIDASARLGSGVRIGAYVVIGENVSIGDNTVIHPHVVVYSGASIGKGCVLHSGAVVREDVRLGDDCQVQNGVIVGGDGFGYFPDRELGHRRIPHIGTVVLEDGVDLGANTTVDRGTFGETRIGRGTKIDNLVMVAHNVQIGSASLVCGQVGISGSAKIGDQVVLAGQVGVADHSEIGSQTRIAAKSGIFGKVDANQTVAGYPPVKHQNWRRTQALLIRLPELFSRIRSLERRSESEDE